LNVRAIIALTESGSTTLWMSRVRSDIPVFAFTRHEATPPREHVPRRVRGAVRRTGADRFIDEQVFATLLNAGAVSPGDLVLFTKGDQQGVAGRTNTMQILTVPAADAARPQASG
jgi:pyruvate kinase